MGDGPAGNRLTGKVVDATPRQVLPFTLVTVYKQVAGKDSLLTGSQTDEQGGFTVLNLPAGILTVRVTFVGYQTFSQAVGMGQEQTDSLALKPDASTLKEVKLVSEKSETSMTMEKRTLNVVKNLVVIRQTSCCALLWGAPAVCYALASASSSTNEGTSTD